LAAEYFHQLAGQQKNDILKCFRSRHWLLKWLLIRKRSCHRSPTSFAIRRMFEKREKIFQLISSLFCEVKIGFVDPWKLSLWRQLSSRGWKSADFLQGVLSPKYLQDQWNHTCSITEISMGPAAILFLVTYLFLCTFW
jgi:hypothetical protein